MYKSLITFGDSWPAGAELGPKEKPFGKLLAEKLNCQNFYNYALPGSSIPHLILQLRSFTRQIDIKQIDPEKTLAVFFLTGHERFMYWDKSWINLAAGGATIEPGVDRDSANQHHELYYKYFHSSVFDNHTLNVTVLAVEKLCEIYNIDILFVAGWEKALLWNEINSAHFFENGKITCADICCMMVDKNFHKNEFTSASGGHPNQQGHQMIADRLFKWITSEKFFNNR